VSALEFAVDHDLPGVYNAAGDGVLALSEVIDLLGKRPLPILPPWATGLATGPLRRIGLKISSEMESQLRFGRGLDNRKLKSAGFSYRRSSKETVIRFAEDLRLRSVMRGIQEPYRYEKEVEDFLRWSPSVRNRTYPEEAPRYFPPAPASGARPERRRNPQVPG
jgi:UDP-glucose 4-epimerase